MNTINTSWDRIESWLAQNAADILSGLALGATEAEIASAEKELGVEFPEDVRESYKRHNGQMHDPSGFIVGGSLIDVHELQSLSGIIRDWRIWKELLDSGAFKEATSEPVPEIKADWWNTRWIPLTKNDAGDNYCLDLAPTSNGTTGQIITMWHDQPERELVAHGFAEWLEKLAQDMENGLLAFSDDYGGVISVDDL